MPLEFYFLIGIINWLIVTILYLTIKEFIHDARTKTCKKEDKKQ